jgi:hypothetical protein
MADKTSKKMMNGAAVQWENLIALYEAVRRVVPNEQKRYLNGHMKARAEETRQYLKDYRSRTPVDERGNGAGEARIDQTLSLLLGKAE